MCHGSCGIPRNLVIVPEDVNLYTSRMLVALQKVADLGGKEGGMLCVMNQETGEFVVGPVLIGEVETTKLEKYTNLCVEKAERLRSHIPDGHRLSWESHDPDNGKWGGAISDGDHIWSFSGLTEEQDEALMLVTAHYLGRITNGAPYTLAEISNNRTILNRTKLFWVHAFED